MGMLRRRASPPGHASSRACRNGLCCCPKLKANKEGVDMKYRKPQITDTKTAVAVIHSQSNKMAGVIDTKGNPRFVTPPAYESDE